MSSRTRTDELSKMAIAGVVVTRLVVPLWLLSGVILALSNGNVGHLPASLVKWLGPMGVNLVFVLYLGVAVELTVVGIAWGLPRLARLTETALLLVFLPILVGDIVLGAASCGCFGAVQVSPWLTLAIDVILLIGVAVLGGRAQSLRLEARQPSWRVIVVGLWTIGVFAFSFGIMAHRGNNHRPAAANLVGEGLVTAPELPEYYLPSYAEWLGMSWSDIPVASFMTGDLSGLDEGLRYLVFYRKDCEHCHELMAVYFNDALPGPTTAVAVPEKNGFPTVGVQEFECNGCALAELPAGCDWFFQTPVLVRLRDGVVECAAEVSAADPQCLLW